MFGSDFCRKMFPAPSPSAVTLPCVSTKYLCNTIPHVNPLSKFLLRLSVSSNIGNTVAKFFFCQLIWSTSSKPVNCTKCKEQEIIFSVWNSLVKNTLELSSFLSHWEFRGENLLQLVDVSVALETALISLKVFCELCWTQILSQAFP